MTDLNLPMEVIPPEPPQPLMSDEAESQALYPVEALGSLLGAAVSAISSAVRVPESLAAQSVLSAAAMAAQPHANLILDGRILPLSLFFLTVAESGDRKSGADRPALRAHHEHQRALVSAYREQQRTYRIEKAAYDKACEALLKQSKGDNMEGIAEQVAALPEPQMPRQPFILAEEPTLEGLQKAFLRGQSSMGLFSDEGGQFFGGNAMKPENLLKSVSGLSKFWDGSPINRTRASDEESASCYGSRLSAHLMMQPVVAKEVLANPIMQGQGFLARFLVSWPESLAGSRLYRSIDLNADPCMGHYWQRMTELLKKPLNLNDQGELDPRSITLTPEAKALWIAEHDRIEGQLGRLGDYADIKAVGSKAAEQILRIAGVLAVVDDQASVDSNILQRAIELGRWYLGEALRLCYPVRQDPELVKAQKLIDWLHAKGWTEFDARTLQREGPSFVRKSAHTRNRLLNKLVIARHLSADDSGKIYRTNPLSLATFATPATSPVFQGVELCDASATPCDKAATRPLSPDFVATLSQPVAMPSQAESPVNTRLVAEVANVASSEASNLIKHPQPKPRVNTQGPIEPTKENPKPAVKEDQLCLFNPERGLWEGEI